MKIMFPATVVMALTLMPSGAHSASCEDFKKNDTYRTCEFVCDEVPETSETYAGRACRSVNCKDSFLAPKSSVSNEAKIIRAIATLDGSESIEEVTKTLGVAKPRIMNTGHSSVIEWVLWREEGSPFDEKLMAWEKDGCIKGYMADLHAEGKSFHIGKGFGAGRLRSN